MTPGQLVKVANDGDLLSGETVRVMGRNEVAQVVLENVIHPEVIARAMKCLPDEDKYVPVAHGGWTWWIEKRRIAEIKS